MPNLRGYVTIQKGSMGMFYTCEITAAKQVQAPTPACPRRALDNCSHLGNIGLGATASDSRYIQRSLITCVFLLLILFRLFQFLRIEVLMIKLAICAAIKLLISKKK